jgi:hypothetical protein
MQIHNKNGENEISEFYNKKSDEHPSSNASSEF